jgi:hypothetical protein
LTVISGRNDGGRHFYFTRPGGDLSRARLPKGVDLKTQGGYVILPPSVHPASGLPYRWENPEITITFPPLALRELIKPLPRPIHTHIDGTDGSGLLRAVAEAEEGRRNDVLYWAANRAQEDDLDLEDELISAAVAAGLSEIEALRTVRSAARGADS